MFSSRDKGLPIFPYSFWSPICFQYTMLSEAFSDSFLTKSICLLSSLGFIAPQHLYYSTIPPLQLSLPVFFVCLFLCFSHWIVDSLKTQTVNYFPQHFQILIVRFENQSQNDAQTERQYFPNFAFIVLFFILDKESFGEYFSKKTIASQNTLGYTSKCVCLQMCM